MGFSYPPPVPSFDSGPRRRLGFLATTWWVLSLLTVSVSALAAAPADTPSKPVATFPPAKPTAVDPTQTPMVWKRWDLFDPFVDPYELFLGGGVVQWTERHRARRFEGYGISFGERISTRRGPLLVTGKREVSLRFMDQSTFALGLATLSFAGGARLGPFEVSAGPGLTMVDIDHSVKHFSLGFFAPRASLQAGVWLGPIRIGAVATREYHWRWWGRSSALADLMMIEVSLLQSPKTHRFGRPLIVVE